MKNVINFLAVIMFITTVSVQAQNKTACSAKDLGKKVEMLKEKLSLSGEQVEKITALVASPGEDFEIQIKEVLTPAQYTTYQGLSKGSCCKKDGKKSCEKKDEKKSCCKKDGKKSCEKKDEKKSCCKKDKKKSCEKKDEKKSCCKKGEKKSCKK